MIGNASSNFSLNGWHLVATTQIRAKQFAIVSGSDPKGVERFRRFVIPSVRHLQRIRACLGPEPLTLGIGARPFATFLKVTLPLSIPGVATGCMLVFILLMGEFLIPALLGGGKVFFIGNALVDLFLQSRNWPFGSAVAIALVAIMLVAVGLYLAMVGRERTRSDVSLV